MKLLLMALFFSSAYAAVKPDYTVMLGEGYSVTYSLEGQAGTKDTTEVWRCRITDEKSKKVLAKDLLCKTETVKADGEKDLSEARFKLKDKLISYEFEELKKNIPLTHP